MPSSSMIFNEGEVVKLVTEFLHNRGFNISMLNVERETGIINGVFSDDMLFLRQLVLDGQWDDMIDFVQPLGSFETFNIKQFQYITYKHKYLELLCLKAENAPMQNYEVTVDEVVKCLNTLEDLCPTKEDYSNLCLLLTLPRLSDHAEYQNWNPSNARVECWKEIATLVEKYMPIDKRDAKSADRLNVATNDRLVQLLIKGILYESCVEFCQHKATSSEYDCKDIKLSSLLNTTGFSDADLSLLSWLQAVPHDTFACPFEQKALNVDVKPLEKPSLEASWSEQILVTPIKPKMFPYSAVPSGRPRSADIMSRSLNPQYDGLAFGLATGGRRDSVTGPGDASLLSRSFAGFHLLAPTNKSLMHTSIDKLFESNNTLETHTSISEETPVRAFQSPHPQSTPPPSPKPGPTSTPMEKTRPTTSPPQSESPRRSVTMTNRTPEPHNGSLSDSSSDLYKEYQKQKQLLQEKLEEQEKQRRLMQEELMSLEQHTLQQLQMDDNRLIDSGVVSPLQKAKTYDEVIHRGKCVPCLYSPLAVLLVIGIAYFI